MTLTIGTPVSAPLTAGYDERNTFPTHLAKLGQGGFEVRANLADIKTISVDRRKDKLCFSLLDKKFYRYDDTAADWVEEPIYGSGLTEDEVKSLFGVTITPTKLSFDREIFTPKISTNPSTVVIGNINVSGANKTLSLVNSSDGKRAILIAVTYNTDGSTSLKSYNLGAESIVDRQLDSSEIQPSNPYTFTFTIPDDIIRTGLILKPAESGLLTIESKDVNGALITDTETITIEPNQVGTEVEVTLKNHVVYLTGEVASFTLSGVKQYGKTINGVFIPYFKGKEYPIISRPEVVTQHNIGQFATYPLFQNISADANFLLDNGVYSVNSSTLNIPVGILNENINNAKIRVTGSDNNHIIQEFIINDFDSTNNVVRSIFYRVKKINYWSEWKMVALNSDVVHLNGDESINGIKTFNSFPLTPESLPSSNYQVANKKYVDDGIAPINNNVTTLGNRVTSLENMACFSAISNQTTALTTTPVTLRADTVKVTENFTYNNSTGELHFDIDGCYDIHLTVTINSTVNNRSVSVWMENLVGGSWTPIPDMGYFRDFPTTNEVEIVYNMLSEIPAGSTYRLRALSNNTGVNIESKTLANGVKMPSIRLSIHN